MRRQYELEKENREKARREQQEAARKIEEIQKKGKICFLGFIELQAKMEEDIKTLEIEKQRREKPMKEREIKENEQQEEIDTEYEERRKQEFNVREILEKRDEKSSLLNEGSIWRIVRVISHQFRLKLRKRRKIWKWKNRLLLDLWDILIHHRLLNQWVQKREDRLVLRILLLIYLH